MSVGWADVCGVTTANVGYCWGHNSVGQDGNNNTTQQTSPALVSGGLTWSSITEGGGVSCGVTTTNVGYCWGSASGGQLGDNNAVTNEKVPTAVSGAYSWSVIDTGGNDTCGITTLGVGYCWGSNGNGSGADGNGGTSENDVPALVTGSHTWAQISEGANHTCGLTTAGVAYCWGTNGAGEVGDGTTSSRSNPTAVSGGLTFVSIVVGDDSVTVSGSGDDTSCGLTVTGIEYCWGFNDDSQIGDGTTTNRLVPTEVSLLFAITGNVTVNATVTPAFTFTVANQSSACNGESNFVTGAGTASTVALGNLAAGANVSGDQALTIVGNSGGGFAVYVAGNHATNDLRNGSHNWTDVTGTYASPAVLRAGERFGYTYHDSTTSSAVTNPASAHFVALTNAATNEVIGSSSSESGNGCVSFDAQASASTPAASYTATVIYTAVPTF
jgi:hypothetical protein